MFFKGPRPLFDYPTMILILMGGGIYVGIVGLFKFDVLEWAFGQRAWIAQSAIGISAVWQTLRQRW
jgi:uncharacterized membrane protein YuzA (DUF378 family)